MAARQATEGFAGDFDGKIDGPLLDEIDHAGGWRTIGRWDFASTHEGAFVAPEVTGNLPQAIFVNAPTRAVTSSRFNGRCNSFIEAPGQYDAVLFHRDDLADAGWETSFRMTVPQDAAGVYSIVLSERPEADWQDRSSFDAIPVFVRPSPGSAARISLVLPTFSYRAYANNSFAEEADPRIFKRKKKSVSAPLYDYAARHRLLSLYDRHCDGSGVCLASLKRPQATIRADFDSQLQGFAHQFSADLAIVEWLNRLDMPFDILTDEILHEEGIGAIGKYDVLVTGSHPEYSSSALLDAYDDFAGDGGSILYLGGNGFYWSVGTAPEHPEMLEVRRSEGTRTWTALPGERRQQLDGRDGGLWRSLGRPPNRTFGIGFSAHGFSGDGHYRAAPDLDFSQLPKRLAAFFSAAGEACFGIAGLELDRHAPEHGSAPGVIVLAAAEGMPYGYLPTVEELGGLDELIPDPKEALARLIRGNITLYRHPGGGLVFSVGSIRWTSGLLDPDDRASVRRLTTAALCDLLDHRE